MMPGLYIKLGIGIAVIALLTSAYFYIHGKGYDKRDREVQAQLAQQIVQGATDLYALVQHTAALERDHQEKVDLLTETINLNHETVVVKYVQGASKKCVVSPELERAHDGVSGLLHDQPTPADRVPASAVAPGVVAEPQKAELTDVALLSAYEYAIVELAELWNDYASLVQWVRDTHALQMESAGRSLLKETP